MRTPPMDERTQVVLYRMLVNRAAELGIDPDSVWQPSPHALAAWRDDGSLLRLDFNVWPAAQVSR